MYFHTGDKWGTFKIRAPSHYTLFNKKSKNYECDSVDKNKLALLYTVKKWFYCSMEE